MKRLLMICTLLRICFISFAQSYDAMRIVAFRDNFETVHNISRSLFLDIVNETTRDICDTLITDATKINELQTSLRSLKFVKYLPVDTRHTDMDSVLIETKKGAVYIPYERNSLDNRMLIRLYRKNKEIDRIWLSVNMVDIGRKRYLINERLKAFFAEYTNLFRID